MTDRRLIEVDFPLKEVSEQSVREKNIRHGHISTLHIWWARRPLAASRATALAALIPDEPERREELLRLVAQIAPWEVVSRNDEGSKHLLEKARKLIREAHGGRAPKVLDCFAGGGAIPLEALRLGCETYALDYNPVAVLVNKAVLEYPQRFRKELLEAVKHWGNWVLEEARKELEEFYPKDPDGSIPVGYLWARTIPCQNAECRAEIPLMRQTWLAKKSNKKVALRLVPNHAERRVDFEIVEGDELTRSAFDPEEGTVARANVHCPLCGGTMDAKTTRRLFREGKSGQRMIAVVLHHPERTGKSYRLPTERDVKAYCSAEAALEVKRQALLAEWGVDPVPDEPLPPKETLGFRVQRYGLLRWGDLFNARQKLALITFAEKVRLAYETLTPGPSPTLRERGEALPSPEALGEGGRGDEGKPSRELIERARQLRKEATGAEQLLWELLRDRQLLGRKFRRQHPLGRFIADFFCDDARLVIEIDGAIHVEPTQQERDRAREEILERYGYRVLRFRNEQVLNQTEQVLEAIAEFVLTHSFEHQHPSPQAWGEGLEGEGPGVRAESTNPEFAQAVATYLALAVDMTAAFCNTLARWENTSEAIKQLFSRQALPMLWDYAELNPFSSSTGSWEAGWEYYQQTICHLAQISSPETIHSTATHGSATSLPWPEDTFDAVLTDPPYYDNVPYSYLSDFFYVWLKRTVGNLYPELFATPLAPKTQDMVAYVNGGDPDQAKQRFEEMLTQAFREIRRVLKPDGTTVIVFAHKTTAAWEAIIQALLDAGLFMTASWPVHTEMQARLRAQESAALASSIYMVCRKRTTNETGEFPKVRQEIETRVRQKLEQFWNEGIRGADFFMSAIGPAVEAFGKYAKVEKLSGEPVTVSELLEHVRQVVSRFALERILKDAELGGVDAPTRFYLLWRWTYNHAKVRFDEARKLAQGVGIELTEHWDRAGFVKKEKEYVRVMAPQDRDADLIKREHFESMVDVLHKAVLLWEHGDRKGLEEHLLQNPFSGETLRRVSQAVAEVLPDGDKEKQLLQGLLYGWREAARPAVGERGLFEGS